VVTASTASNVSSVAFVASAAANGNGSGGVDFEKPLDMLLEEDLEMWKEKENDSMDEGVQEDEQFEMKVDNEETGGSECSSASENSEEDDKCWKCGSDPNRVEWVSECRNVEHLGRKQNEGREWVKSHFMLWAEASFK